MLRPLVEAVLREGCLPPPPTPLPRLPQEVQRGPADAGRRHGQEAVRVRRAAWVEEGHEGDLRERGRRGTGLSPDREGLPPPPTVESPPPVPRALGLPPSGSFCSGGALAMGGRATVLLESGMGRHL